MRYIAICALLVSSLVFKGSIAFGDAVSTEDGYIAVEESASEAQSDSSTDEIAVVEKVETQEAKPKVATNEYGSTASDAASALGTKAYYAAKRQGSDYSLSPAVGGSFYAGRWSHHIGNAYTFGLLLERRFSNSVSAEVEGSYGSYNITYLGLMHDFNKFSVGVNSKFYLLNGSVRPFFGVGLLAVHYENMFSGSNRFNQWIAAPQLMIGSEYQLSNSLGIGVRAAWVMPALGLPETRATAEGSLPGFEEASAIRQDYFKVLGTLKVGL